MSLGEGWRSPREDVHWKRSVGQLDPCAQTREVLTFPILTPGRLVQVASNRGKWWRSKSR